MPEQELGFTNLDLQSVLGNMNQGGIAGFTSLYDMYVNAIATKDYYLDKGLPGTPFHQMLTNDNITRREFNFWGKDALKRVPAYEE